MYDSETTIPPRSAEKIYEYAKKIKLNNSMNLPKYNNTLTKELNII